MSVLLHIHTMAESVDTKLHRLKTSMGFREDRDVGPYLRYIESQAPRGERLLLWLQLFIDIVTTFQSSNIVLSTYIDTLTNTIPHPYFDAILHLPQTNRPLRRSHVKDTVYAILGLWSLLRNYFIPQTLPFRYLESVSASEETTLIFSSLVTKSKFLPSPQSPSTAPVSPIPPLPPNASSQTIHSSLVESLAISPTRLNAYTLSTYAQTSILWTSNISRHLLLSQYEGKHFLEVFALPCVLSGRSSESLKKIGLSSALGYEIQNSYSLLFNPDGGHGEGLVHQRWGSLRRWAALFSKSKSSSSSSDKRNGIWNVASIHWICPCRSCSSFRFLRRELNSLKRNDQNNTTASVVPWEPAHFGFDATVEELATKKIASGGGWSQTRYPLLWDRIVKCDMHLREARPWSFWVLFRDRRDTLQFWTFLFGSLILILTFMQVALGVAQVVGTF